MLLLGNHEFCNSVAYYKSTEIIKIKKKKKTVTQKKKGGSYSINKALRKIISYFIAIWCSQVHKNPKIMDY